jgi:hypothetical protein
LPPWSLCAGGVPPAGNFPRVTDPWTSFGPDGIGYRSRSGSTPSSPSRQSRQSPPRARSTADSVGRAPV